MESHIAIAPLILLAIFIIVVVSLIRSGGMKALLTLAVMGGLLLLFLVVPFVSYQRMDVGRQPAVVITNTPQVTTVRDSFAVPEPSLPQPPASAASTSSEESEVEVDESLPEWIQNAEASAHSGLAVVRGKFAMTKDESLASAVDAAIAVIKHDFDQAHATGESWALPRDIVETTAIRRRHTETQDIKLPTGTTAEMHRSYAQVELSPAVTKAIHPHWREQVVAQRLVGYGAWVGGLTLALLALTTYFRLERGRPPERSRLGLKFVTAAVMVLGSMGIWQACHEIRAEMADQWQDDRPIPAPGPGSLLTSAITAGARGDTPASLDDNHFFGIPIESEKIAIIVDAGESMMEFNKAWTTREEISQLLDANAPCYYRLSTWGAVHSANCSHSGEEREESQIRSLLYRACHRKRWSSPPVMLFEQAIEIEPDVILFVTDAVGTRFDEGARQRILNLAGTRVHIHCVQLLTGQSEPHDESLRILARQTGGEYRYWIASGTAVPE